MRLVSEKRREKHILSNEEKLKWNKNYLERETPGAKKRVQDIEAAVQQEQNNMTDAEIMGLATPEPEMTSEEMLVAIGNSLCDLGNSVSGEGWDDDDD